MTSCGATSASCPPRQIGIFNRSHYEEVLVVRVHPELLEREQLPPRPRGRRVAAAVREINDWERYLVQNGIVVVKLFLHSPTRSSAGASCAASTTQPELEVLGQRHRGTPVLGCLPVAFSEMLSETSTRWAPGTCCRRPQVVHPPGGSGRGGKRTPRHRPRYPDVEGPSRRRCGGAHRARGGVVEATALTGTAIRTAWPLGGKRPYSCPRR